MSSPPPTKPPRGVKQGRETSGLLMSVIRTLSASETHEQREKERAKLEREFKKSDARLDELVAEHHPRLLRVSDLHAAAAAALGEWRARDAGAGARLAAARRLLCLRRDDLRRLWAEARTHHHALHLLTLIERAVSAERAAGERAARGLLLGAAHELRAALDATAGDLARVDALAHTRHDLQIKKSALAERIVATLSRAVYAGEANGGEGGGRAAPAPASARRRAAALLVHIDEEHGPADAGLDDITPEWEAASCDEERSFDATAALLLEALGVLGELGPGTDKFKVNIQSELLDTIGAVVCRVREASDADADPEPEIEADADADEAEQEEGDGGETLARLVRALDAEFGAVAARHARLLPLWRAALERHRVPLAPHALHHYWSAVQQVTQLVLREHLDMESVVRRARAQQTAPAHRPLPLAAYFAKKRPTPQRRVRLFRLRQAAGAGGAEASAAPEGTRVPLVCRPDPAHLRRVLPALHDLIAHVESATGGGECSLRAFVSDYVRHGEAERLAGRARSAVEGAVRAPAAWREAAPPPAPHWGGECSLRAFVSDYVRHGEAERLAGRARSAVEGAVRAPAAWREAAPPPAPHPHRLIYTCCSAAWAGVERAAAGVRAAGACGGADAARALLDALGAFAAAARAAHHQLAPPPSSRAARWLADDDIARFLQALPNWRAAIAPLAAPTPAADLRDAYRREADILGSSLGDGAIAPHEIVPATHTLRDLALMCESMDWVAARVRELAARFGRAPAPAGPSPVFRLPDKLLDDIESTALIFEEISHKCLLLLHLELRIQCFYYLGQEENAGAGAGAAGCEESGSAAEVGAGSAAGVGEALARALLAFHEMAAPVLAPHRLAYVMEGLAEMMSAGVIWRCVSGAGTGAGTGAGAAAARLTALRHCLASLSVSSAGLHRAAHYLQLLECSPEEVVGGVEERGAHFSELEYLHALRVTAARHRLPEPEMRAAQRRLAAALGHTGVTV